MFETHVHVYLYYAFMNVYKSHSVDEWREIEMLTVLEGACQQDTEQSVNVA